MNRVRLLIISFILLLTLVANSFLFADSHNSNTNKPTTISYGVSFIPTIHSYESMCGELKFSLELEEQVISLCNIVVESNICKEVKPDDLLECNKLNSEEESTIWALISGCARGVLSSAKELLIFIWDIMKWVWDISVSSVAREKTKDNVSRYASMAKLYLHAEYSKAYSNSSPPVQALKAAAKMGGAISKLIYDSISDLISKEYKEFGCLNFNAKSKLLCKFVADIFIPPAAAIAFIKHGPKAVKLFPGIKKALKGLGKTRKKYPKKRVIKIVGKGKLKVKAKNGGVPVETEFPLSSSTNLYREALWKKGKKPFVLPAHHYGISLKTSAGKTIRFDIVIPTKKNGKPDLKKLQKLEKILAKMPEEALEDLKLLRVNKFINGNQDVLSPAVRAGAMANFDEKMMKGVIDIFPRKTLELPLPLVVTVAHELGHIMHFKKYAKVVKKYGKKKVERGVPGKDWEKAIGSDKGIVSLYGTTNSSEDFAEAVRLYIITDGAAVSPKTYSTLEHRFKILDEIFSADVKTRKEIYGQLKERMAKKKRSRRIFWTTSGGVGAARMTSLMVGNKMFIENNSDAE